MNDEMKDWVIIESKRGYHKEFGYPIGRILCRNKYRISEIIKDNGIDDPIITPYLKEKGK